MLPLHFHCIAGVVLIHGEGGDEDRAVDADLVHRRDHLVTRDVRGPVRHAVPRPLRRVRLVGVDLRIDDRHGKPPPYAFRSVTGSVTRAARSRASSSAFSPSNSASTASVCWPSVGAGLRISDLPPVWSRIGEIGTRVGPRRGWVMSTQKPRASRWGSYATSRAVLTGAPGTGASLSSRSTSSFERGIVPAPTTS